MNFTAANDGAYGHDIEGYEIYRADENGKYKLLDTLELDDLKKADGSSTADDEEEEDHTPKISSYVTGSLEENESDFHDPEEDELEIIDLDNASDDDED